MKSLAAYVFLIALFGYAGIALFAGLMAERMIFQPPPSSYWDGTDIIKVKTNNGSEISAVHLKNSEAKYTLLFSHGNAVDLGAMYPILEEIRAMGFSVFAYDYSGYGTSGGSASEANAYGDVNAAYQFLTEERKIPSSQIIAHGQSLGGGVAADLAARKPLGGLILESTFTTAYRVMTRIPLLPFDQFKTVSKLKKIDCPLLVIHGKEDRVISFWHGQSLFEQAREPKRSFWVDRAGHNNLLEVAGSKYEDALQDFTVMISQK